MKLTTEQMDRARGVILGCAVGDVLGVPWEFKPSQGFALDHRLGMPGGGPFGFDPGEWSDDTSMTLAVAQAAYDGHDLTTMAGLSATLAGFLRWRASGPKDMGSQVSSALAGATVNTPARKLLKKSADRYAHLPKSSGGNGSLMRTSPVALRHLAEPKKMERAAGLVSGLTHADPDALTACVLWCHGIRSAVLDGDPIGGIKAAMDRLPEPERTRWTVLAGQAFSRWPEDFPNNGWVVTAFQAALSAVSLGLEENGYEPGIVAAVGCGHDTDTVGAIAGAMLGATFGYSGIRRGWRKQVHGWPGVKGSDLPRIAEKIAKES
ncbi:hydrolase [Streptomyces phage LazerLemon]|nr:hydrolase [Streptomyces phage LazerLemon]